MLDLKQPEIQFALHAVQQAAILARLVQAEMIQAGNHTASLTKEDRSPVTVADFAIQAFTASLLAEAFPSDLLIGEESSGALHSEPETLERVAGFVQRFKDRATPEDICAWIDRGAKDLDGTIHPRRFWTLDPIDGTKGFLRGDQYVVALALVIDGQVEMGVLGCPNLRDGSMLDVGGPGSILAARRGLGAWSTTLQPEQDSFTTNMFQRLVVSTRSNPSQARLLRSFEASHTNVEKIDELAGLLNIEAEAVRMDSQAKFAILAAGAGEVIIRLLPPKQPEYREKIWDMAAGSIILEEAGGRISDLDGKAFDFTTGRILTNNRGVLATNGLLHPVLLDALAQIKA